MSRVVVDANVLVAFVDERDKWHNRSAEIITKAMLEGWKGVIPDLILFEAISVISKRFLEQGRSEDIPDKIDKLLNIFLDQISWSGGMIEGWFSEIVEIVKKSGGNLNFNDAFIVVFCEKNKIEYVMSFDRDFDGFEFIKRIE